MDLIGTWPEAGESFSCPLCDYLEGWNWRKFIRAASRRTRRLRVATDYWLGTAYQTVETMDKTTAGLGPPSHQSAPVHFSTVLGSSRRLAGPSTWRWMKSIWFRRLVIVTLRLNLCAVYFEEPWGWPRPSGGSGNEPSGSFFCSSGRRFSAHLLHALS